MKREERWKGREVEGSHVEGQRGEKGRDMERKRGGRLERWEGREVEKKRG